jgi:signal peptidase I
MKVLGLAVPKAIVSIVLAILATAVVGVGLVAAVPQVRVILYPLARYVPAVGPARGLTVRVDGPSMAPEFPSGQYVTVLPLTSDRPQRCDVVIYHPPAAPDQLYLKRVAATGGDTVTFTLGSVEVNGNAACPRVLHGASGPQFANNPQTVTISTNVYFVVGDNLLSSLDSRFSGAIPRSSIVGYLPG